MNSEHMCFGTWRYNYILTNISEQSMIVAQKPNFCAFFFRPLRCLFLFDIPLWYLQTLLPGINEIKNKIYLTVGADSTIDTSNIHYLQWTIHKIIKQNSSKKLEDTNQITNQSISKMTSWGSFCSWCLITCLHVLSIVLWCPQRFPRQRDARFVLNSIWFVGIHV